jgi:hypothetical protein
LRSLPWVYRAGEKFQTFHCRFQAGDFDSTTKLLLLKKCQAVATEKHGGHEAPFVFFGLSLEVPLSIRERLQGILK